MLPFLILVICLVMLVAIVLMALAKKRQGKSFDDAVDFDFEAYSFSQKTLMTDHELRLYHGLVKALPDLVVFPQVSLHALIEPKKDLDWKLQNRYQNRINRLICDFVVMLPDLKTVVAVVELDDASHNRKVQQARDEKKNKALEAAGLPIVRWRQIPTHEQIQQVFLGGKTA